MHYNIYPTPDPLGPDRLLGPACFHCLHFLRSLRQLSGLSRYIYKQVSDGGTQSLSGSDSDTSESGTCLEYKFC